MAFKEALRLVVEADTKGAVKSIEEVGKSADKSLTKGTKGIDKFGASLTKAGVGMIGVGVIAAVGLGKAAQSASDLGEVMSKNQVVFGESSKKVEEFAENAVKIGQSKRGALEAATGFGNLFVSMGLAADKSADMSIELTALASDLASFSNTSPEDAILALSSALVGEAEPIRRYGVLLDEATLKQKALDLGLIKTTTGTLPPGIRAQAAYAAILEQTKTAQGDFARTGDSAANQQRKLTAAFENLKAEIGAGALPVMQSLLDVATKATTGFSGLNSATGGLVGKVATIATVGLIAAGGLSVVVGQAIQARQTFRDLASGVGKLSTKMGGFGNVVKGGAIVAAIFAIDAALNEAFGPVVNVQTANLGRLEAGLLQFEKTGKMSSAAAKVLGTDFGKLGDALATVDLSGIDKARKGLEDFTNKIPIAGRLMESGFSEGVEQARQTLDDFDKALARIAQTDPSAAFDIVKAAAKEMGVSVKDLMPALDDYDSAIGEASAEAEKGGTKVDKFGRSMEGSADKTKEATDALKEYEDKLHAMLDPLFGLQDALQGNLDAQGEVNAKQLEAVAAQQAYTDAVKKHGPHSKAAAEASLELMGAQDALSDANRDAVRSAEDVDLAVMELRTEIQKNPAVLDQAKAKLKQWQAQGLITAGQARKTAREFDGLASSIRKVPGRKTVAVGTSGINSAKVALASVKSQLDRFPTRKDVTIHFAATGLAAISIAEAKLLHRQAGGPIKPDDAYIVGEHGPELFVSDKAGQIIPNGALTHAPVAMGSVAGVAKDGKGGHVQVDVNIVGEGLMRYLRNQVRVEYGGDVQAALGTRR